MFTRLTIKYGRDNERHRYTHSVATDRDPGTALAKARDEADSFLRSTGNGEGAGLLYQAGIRVWVEDAKGKVVYGKPATKKEE